MAECAEVVRHLCKACGTWCRMFCGCLRFACTSCEVVNVVRSNSACSKCRRRTRVRH